MDTFTPGVTPQAPVQVQVVPAPEKASIEERILRHVENTPIPGTLTPGDTQRRQQQQPAPQQQQAAPEAQADQADTQAVAADEHYEFEWNGGRYQVPSELKAFHEAFEKRESMDRDYTQKAQEVAELRRSAEAALQQSKQHQELQQALAPRVARLQSINEQLGQYTNVDWNKLYATDATAAQQHSVNFSVLNNQKQVLEREVQQTAQEHMRKLTDSQNQMLEAADKAMSLKVKGWSRDTGKTLNEFARKTYGFTENEVNSTLDPRALEMMHDARQWRDLQASKATKTITPNKTLKPSASVQQNAAQAKTAELKKGIRTAKTDSERARAVQALLEHRIR
jgi:hypothetical protein